MAGTVYRGKVTTVEMVMPAQALTGSGQVVVAVAEARRGLMRDLEPVETVAMGKKVILAALGFTTLAAVGGERIVERGLFLSVQVERAAGPMQSAGTVKMQLLIPEVADLARLD